MGRGHSGSVMGGLGERGACSNLVTRPGQRKGNHASCAPPLPLTFMGPQVGKELSLKVLLFGQR
jgi:hypothetical protein